LGLAKGKGRGNGDFDQPNDNRLLSDKGQGLCFL